MTTKTQIQRYMWVIDLLMRRRSGLTLKQINEEWKRSSLAGEKKENLNRKTWYKCFDDIEELYGIVISGENCSRYSKWTIENPSDLHDNSIKSWMVACSRFKTVLLEGMGMYQRFDIEGFPSENGKLLPIIRAMKLKIKIEVTYLKYSCSKPKTYVVEPYIIKTYQNRFYVLCKLATGFFCHLAFDRMKRVVPTSEKFNFPTNLFAHEFYKYAYGVMIPNTDEQPLDIVLRAKGELPYYFKDVPFHHSQRIKYECDDYMDFQVKIWPTEDFIAAVRKYGERLEVISPEGVRTHVRDSLMRALSPYNGCE
ncbi:MAG: WYL domain-containing protein [Bacteroidaceae bacterium]|nr:WYL domain-containing protein [Bacteroidaceae bacterium]